MYSAVVDTDSGESISMVTFFELGDVYGEAIDGGLENGLWNSPGEILDRMHALAEKYDQSVGWVMRWAHFARGGAGRFARMTKDLESSGWKLVLERRGRVYPADRCWCRPFRKLWLM